MKDNFDKSLKLVLVHEGGWSNNPKDPGGATNKGITLATYSAWLGRSASQQQLLNLPNEHLLAIYKENYWDKIKADQMPSGVDYAAFDFAVNSGPGRSAKFIQRIVGVAQDGVIGPITLAAINKYKPSKLLTELCEARLAWLQTLSTFTTFGRGWTKRVMSVKKDAIAMIGTIPSPDPSELGGVEKIQTPLWAIIRWILSLFKKKR